MKKNKQILSIALIATMGFSLVACSGATGSSVTNEPVSVTIELGEVYSITDEASEYIDVDNVYTSEDDEIAHVMGGKYIVGYSVGKTTVTVDTGDAVTVYDVEVTDSDEYKLLDTDYVKEMRDVSAYIGAGYNALKASGLLTSSDMNASMALISPAVIDAEIHKRTLMVFSDNTPSDMFMKMVGSSESKYEESYNTEIKGALSLNIGDTVAVGVQGRYKSANVNNNGNASAFNTVISYNRRIRYIMFVQEHVLRDLVKTSNSSAWKSLTGEDGTTAEELFEMYGTHLVTGVDLGGRMEFEYLLTANNSTLSTEDVLNISGEINASISSVKVGVDGFYDDTGIKSQKESDTSTKITVRTFGGDASKDTLITDLDSFQKGYTAWYNTINQDNYGVIGTSATGLLPIWHILDKSDDKQRERYKELENEYKRLMDDIRNKSAIEATSKTESAN